MLSKAFRSLPLYAGLAFTLISMNPAGVAVAQSAEGASQATTQGNLQIKAVPDRLVQPIVDAARVTLGGTMHPLAKPANDRGAVSDSLKLDRLQIVLKRSDAQESELKRLLADMHTQGSASYHQWLTPDDFGKRFGPSDADVATLSVWLQSHGFNVTKLNPGRQTLEVSGTAGQFRDTFKAPIHSYSVNGETRYANASNPQIPAALAPVFGGFASLNNFRLHSQMKNLGKATYDTVTHATQPQWTVNEGSSKFYLLSPADFATQYDFPSQAVAGTNDGTGQSIAIVNDSNINIAEVNRYRTLFGLPANPPRVIVDGIDPGINGENDAYGPNGSAGEAYLDVELAGAVAPNATVNLVIAADTALQGGLELAMERAVYSNIAPVISLSFGGCEAGLGTFNSFFNNLWEQAAAQGITVSVSAGDGGSAGCDNFDTQEYAVSGQAVSGFASTPYNVAVGGTDFYYSDYAQSAAVSQAQIATYWNSTNSSSLGSLKGHLTEQPWNDSQFGFDALGYEYTIAAGSGGASNCAQGTQNQQTGGFNCTGGYAKPSWQSGTGVPADGVRDLPDLSLFASNGANYTFYPICTDDGDCEPVSGSSQVRVGGTGGTSAAAPSFAGIMALVNQKYGRQGQANYVLYALAAQYPWGTSSAPFYDVTLGSNTVPCNLDTVTNANTGQSYAPNDCIAAPAADTITVTDGTYGQTLEGEIGFNGVAAYNAGTGFDLATGLGTIDVANLLTNWGNVKFAATTTTLTAPASTNFAHGTAVTLSGSVAGTTTPTGQVSIETDSTEPGQQSLGVLTLDASGNFTGSFNALPGGTYNVYAYYSGDVKNAASTSAKVQFTVGQQSSTTTLTLTDLNYFTANTAVTANSRVTYGSALLLATQTAGNAKGNVGSPTGSVAFNDGSTLLNTAAVNTEGDAEYRYIASVGTHSISANYSGDASFAASSTASPLSLQVIADTPFLTYNISNYVNIPTNTGGTQTVVFANQATTLTLQVENSVAIGSGAAAPTGTVTLSGAPTGSTTTSTLAASIDPSSGGGPDGIATFTIPAGVQGTYNLTFAYSGDTNYTPIAASANTTATVTFDTFTGAIASTIAATATIGTTPATQTSPTSVVVLTTTVTGTTAGGTAPTGNIVIYSSGVFLTEVALGTGSGLSAVATINVDSQTLNQGTNQLTIQYLGDNTYFPSSTTVNILNPLTDFQMVPATTILTVPTSGTATTTINLASTNSFAGAVNLTCTGAGGVTCSLNPAAATLAAGGSTTATLTVNSAGVTTVGTYNVIVTGTDSTGQFIHTLGLQAKVPVLAIPAPGITVAGGAGITIATQGGSGTSTVTVSPTNGFTGNVSLTCVVSTVMIGASNAPTCSLAPATVTIAAAGVPSTLTVNTTAQTTASLALPGKTLFTLGGGVTLAALFFLGAPLTKRGRLSLKAMRTIRILSAAVVFAMIAGAAMGCGGSSSNGGGGGGGGLTGGTTTGSYTVTITATPATGSPVTTTIAVTVN